MTITEKRAEEKLFLEVEGRIDTNTSRELQTSVLNGFQKASEVVLDLEKVDYISSAGLRVLLIGEKTARARGGSQTLRHVQPQVMEILEMTRFHEILHII